MKEFLTVYGIFLAKLVTIIIFLMVASGIAGSFFSKINPPTKIRLRVTNYNKYYRNLKRALGEYTLDKEELKQLLQQERQEKQQDQTEQTTKRPHLFVLDFDGDVHASSVDGLREAITAILTVANPKDEVLVRLESPGGSVHGYGLAASQLARLRRQQITVTIAVDKVAASGGYLMASVGDKILAAPFAILGSIGVAAELPNFHRLLKKYDIDYEQLTAGKYKRTLSMFGEITPDQRQKTQDELEAVHKLFKDFVALNRPKVDIEKLATGEAWYGSQAKKLFLIDEIMTSDDYLMQADAHFTIIKVDYIVPKQNLFSKITMSLDRLFFH